MSTKREANALVEQLFDFFWVYFDEKTAKSVRRHPSQAIPFIKDAISCGSLSKPKLTVYAEAMQKAISYQSLQMKT